MTETMIERAADALQNDLGPGLDRMIVGRDELLSAVRAVLTAMREPTEAMEHAGARACGGDASCLAAYEAMIDAALAEGV